MLRGPGTGRGLFVASVLATLLALYTRTFVVQAFRIPSDSMAPTLVEGDHILVNKLIYAGVREAGPRDRGPIWSRGLPVRDVRRGDVVVFRSPPGPIVVKRCLGRPDDLVELEKHRLKIDGSAIDESGYYVEGETGSPRDDTAFFGPSIVPSGHYFCLGDHRRQSLDSRSWGPVPASALIGRAILIYWSVGPVAEPVDKTDSEEGPVMRGSRFRWERSFKAVR